MQQVKGPVTLPPVAQFQEALGRAEKLLAQRASLGDKLKPLSEVMRSIEGELTRCHNLLLTMIHEHSHRDEIKETLLVIRNLRINLAECWDRYAAPEEK